MRLPNLAGLNRPCRQPGPEKKERRSTVPPCLRAPLSLPFVPKASVPTNDVWPPSPWKRTRKPIKRKQRPRNCPHHAETETHAHACPLERGTQVPLSGRALPRERWWWGGRSSSPLVPHGSPPPPHRRGDGVGVIKSASSRNEPRAPSSLLSAAGYVN